MAEWALRTERVPDAERLPGLEAEGYRWTGWLHERRQHGDGEPWRVLVFDDEETASLWCPPGCTVEAFDGWEPTVSYRVAWPESAPESGPMVDMDALRAALHSGPAEDVVMREFPPMFADEQDVDDDPEAVAAAEEATLYEPPPVTFNAWSEPGEQSR